MAEFQPQFWTTVVGSFPHEGGKALSEQLADQLDIPDWPQLPRRSFRENMYVQFSQALPAIQVDDAQAKIHFDTSGDLTGALEVFYEKYLADNVDAFALTSDYAQGFFEMLEVLGRRPSSGKYDWIKGQVTGPISFGLTVTDQNLRASLYDETLADVIVKNMAMSARWQARQLKTRRSNAMIFVDEPYMASFGSAYISLSREQVVQMLDEVFDAIHLESALAGVHCCANTDWSVLLATKVDILNLDAFGYLENLALYPHELRIFLDRGGIIAWGIVPNNDEIQKPKASPSDLAQRLRHGLQWISEKAAARGVQIQPEELANRSLIAPSCGLGSTSVEIAEQVIDVLEATGKLLMHG